MNIKKVLKSTCGILVFSALVSFPLLNSFAYNGTQVVPKRKIFDKCKKSKKFSTDEDVYIKARNLFPNKTVDVYITPNRIWRFGTIIDTIVTAEYDLTTDSRGRLPDPDQEKCTLIWPSPLSTGFYDIVVDVNQDGTYNQGDAVFDWSVKSGFKVE